MPALSSLSRRKTGGHRWRFFRAGGLDQIMFRNGADIAHLDELDQKLWVVLSLPTRGVRFDAKTLELLDADKDGRVRAPELLAAIKWTCLHLKDPNVLLLDAESLPLASINDQHPSGALLLAGARRILTNLGAAASECISLAHIADRSAIFAQTKFNGDGIVPADAAGEDAARQVIADIIACLGGETDRSGKPGVSQARLDLFFTAAQAYSDWWDQADHDATIRPIGDATPAAMASLAAVRGKIDDYFARCRLAAFDIRSAAPLNRGEPDFAAIAPLELSLTSPEIARFPISRIEPARPLPLLAGANPYWADALAVFQRAAAVPLLGHGTEFLTEAQWRQIVATLTPYERWMAAKPASPVEALGLARLRAILSGDSRRVITQLIAQDLALETESNQIKDVEKLIRLHRHLNRLLHNYVSLGDFYDPRYAEIFCVGRLHMDGRAAVLCLHVDDMAKHAAMAAAGKIFLAYCEITHPPTGEKRTICAAFTAGFADSLWVGRNGIFYDRDGRDWEAVIIKVVDHPISLKEAFWAPWRKIATMISDQVKKLLAAKQDAALNVVSTNVDKTAKAVVPGTPAATPTKMEGAALASSVAAIGIAIGLMGSAVGGLISTISGLPLWKSLLGVGGVILAVSGPSVILTYFKLRARDLAPVLNACGWAINSRIRMTMTLGREFTQEARLPPGAERELTDPYADSHKTRNWIIAAMVVLITLAVFWRIDWINRYLPDLLRHHEPPRAEAAK